MTVIPALLEMWLQLSASNSFETRETCRLCQSDSFVNVLQLWVFLRYAPYALSELG